MYLAVDIQEVMSTKKLDQWRVYRLPSVSFMCTHRNVFLRLQFRRVFYPGVCVWGELEERDNKLLKCPEKEPAELDAA